MLDTNGATVRRVEADDALVACSTLRRIDHTDAHVVRLARSPHQTPEWWARNIVENVSPMTRKKLNSGWAMLGLKLDHDDSRTVAGWAVSESNAEYIRLHAVSRIGFTGQLVTRLTDEGFEFATFVELRNVAARTLWAGMLPGHLTAVASLLDQAAARAS